MNIDSKQFNEYLNSLILIVQTKKETSAEVYEKIFKAIKPFIYKHGRQVLNRYKFKYPSDNDIGNKAEWEEHLQNLYIEIYECVNKFKIDRKAKFTYYVTVCIQNYFINYAKKHTKKLLKEESIDRNRTSGKKNDDDMGSLLLDSFMSDEKGPEEKYISDETMKKLADALKMLNDEQKRFVYYHYSEGMPITQIGILFGKTYDSMIYLKKKTLKDLKHNFMKYL